MGFDDLAKRMGGPSSGAVGDAAVARDPDQIMAEAQIAARRAARIRDLVLGPLLLLGGLVVVALWISTYRDAATTTDPRNAGSRNMSGYIYIAAAGVGAIGVGIHKILRGIGILKR